MATTKKAATPKKSVAKKVTAKRTATPETPQRKEVVEGFEVNVGQHIYAKINGNEYEGEIVKVNDDDTVDIKCQYSNRSIVHERLPISGIEGADTAKG